MTARNITVAAAHPGPIQQAEPRTVAVERMLRLMERVHQRGVELVVFPELGLTTFFPRHYHADIAEADHWFETAMPPNETAPLFAAARRYGIGFHVGYAERLHGDDTTVPVLARGKTHTGRCWVYVRDDRPFGGPAPLAAVFYYSRDRAGEHLQRHLEKYAGILQADAYGGYNKIYESDRRPSPIQEAACWVHARREFFVLADLAVNARRKAQGKTAAVISPMAFEALRHIDALFDIEREINGKSADRRRAVRQELSAPLVAELEAWLRQQRATLSRHNDVAQAIDYMLKRWAVSTRFLDDGHICMSNDAAERALRGMALGRKSWLFAGSDRGGARTAFMYSLIVTCLCRARHRQVYAERRTMPSQFLRRHAHREFRSDPFGIVRQRRNAFKDTRQRNSDDHDAPCTTSRGRSQRWV